MALVQIRAPAIEPVSLAEAKAQLRVDEASEDVLIGALIQTSRLVVEAACGLALVSQDWRLQLDEWPTTGSIALPLAPLVEVLSVAVVDATGTLTPVPAIDYQVDAVSRPPRIAPLVAGWPAPGRACAGIAVEFTAGFGATSAAVPAPLRQAILLLVAHWFEHREPTLVGHQAAPLPAMLDQLLQPYREIRL